MLQKVLGLAQDGSNGPMTQAAAAAMAEPEMFLVARLAAYQADKNWNLYKNGWTKRLFVISAEVGR